MNKEKILIVEDESVIALDISDMLKQKGYEVCGIASSAEEAADLTEKHEPDLILMDIILSGKKDGITAAKEIKKKYDIPIVYLTAHSNCKVIDRAKKTEPYGYIIKPIKQEDLLSTVAIAIYKHGIDNKLRMSEERYKSLVEVNTQGIQEVDEFGIITYTNPAYQKILGYTKEELLGKSMLDLLASESAKEELREYLPFIVKEQPNPITYYNQNLTKDGRTIDVSVDWNYKRDSEGHVTGFISVITDITERKKAEESLHMAQFSVDKAAFGVFWINEDASFVYVNDEACRCLGYTHDELMKLKIPDIDPYFPMEKWKDHWKDLKERGSFKVETRHKRKDGTIFPVEVTVNYLEFQGKKYNFAFASDITERKKAEEKIKASLKEKEILLAEIHHRVKNNMQVISSLSNLQSSKIKDEDSREQFDTFNNRIRSMAIVHEMLYKSNDFASVNFKSYLYKLIDKIYKLNSESINVISHVVIIKDLNLCINMAIPCGQIINELVSNATKHAFPGGIKGEIKIDFQKDKAGNHSFSVKDNGIGLPKGFDINSTTSLGFKLVHMLTEQLKGEIKVSGKKGTKILITFPG